MGQAALRFRGTDVRSWLQGQITNDIRLLSAERPIQFGLCTPTGQLIALGELREEGGFVEMLGDESSLAALESRLATHVVMEDIGAERIQFNEPVRETLDLLEQGIPVFGVDTGPKTILSELGPRLEAQTISYTKGCYTGQEILHRIHARGGPKTWWMGLKTESLVAPGVYGFVVVTRSANSPTFGPIAVAHIRREQAVPGTILDLDGVSATVVEMPFR